MIRTVPVSSNQVPTAGRPEQRFGLSGYDFDYFNEKKQSSVTEL
jgi:hypothetical protein